MHLLEEDLHLNVDTADGDWQEGVCPVGPKWGHTAIDNMHMCPCRPPGTGEEEAAMLDWSLGQKASVFQLLTGRQEEVEF